MAGINILLIAKPPRRGIDASAAEIESEIERMQPEHFVINNVQLGVEIGRAGTTRQDYGSKMERLRGHLQTDFGTLNVIMT